MSNSVFEKFKRKPQISGLTGKESALFFQILADEEGAYLVTVDDKGNEINADYRQYHGSTRDVLLAIEKAKEKSSLFIDWQRSNAKLYLTENDTLFRHLRYTDQLIDSGFEPVQFIDNEGCLILSIDKEDNGNLTGKILLSTSEGETGDFTLLSDNYALSDHAIYRINGLNSNLRDLFLFETVFFNEDIERYLSLFYSHFGNVFLRYQDFRYEEGAPVRSQTALIFEQVDDEQSLYMRVGRVVEGFDVDFFERYEISRIAVVDVAEQVIQVSPVVEEEAFSCFSEVQTLLNKHKRALKDEEKSDFLIEDNLFIIETTLAQRFIYDELSQLITRYSLLGADKLKSYKIRAVTPKLNLSLNHGIDFLEGDADLEIEGEIFSLFEALKLYRKKSYIPLTDGTHALVNQSYIDKLERLFRKKQEKVEISFFDLPIVEELIDEKTASKGFVQSRAVFRGFNELHRKKVQLPKINATLRPYQEQGYKWLNYLHTHVLGGCLADDMGLGKTLQAIAILSGVYPKQGLSSLIVMPKSLIFNWQSELNRFNPELNYYVYYDKDRNLDEAKKQNLILTTYGIIRSEIEQFKEEPFYYIILDESQSIKNIHSKVSRAVMLLNAKHRLALSGTPIENNLSELYGLFRFLLPNMFGSVDEFTRRYLNPIQKFSDKTVTRELRKKIYPFVLRRLKKDVLKDLPDKVEKTLYVEMSPKQKTLYHQRRIFYQENLKHHIAANGIEKSQFLIFQAFNELRQIASIPESKSGGIIKSPKREVLMEHILESTANGHKVLVFGNFLSIIEHVGEDMIRSGIDYLVMTGATRERGPLVERFQKDPACRVFLMTLKTGGLGLNLTSADTIFIFDPWWNLAAENQAIDRAHRIGQDKTVFSYKLISRETIEEKILLLQEKKRELFEDIISSDSASIKSFKEEDIDFVFN